MKIYKTDNKGEKELPMTSTHLSRVQCMTIFKAKLYIPFAFINQMNIYPYEVNSPDASRETLKSYQHSICTSCKFYTQKIEGFREVNIPTDADDLPVRTWDFEH